MDEKLIEDSMKKCTDYLTCIFLPIRRHEFSVVTVCGSFLVLFHVYIATNLL